MKPTDLPPAAVIDAGVDVDAATEVHAATPPPPSGYPYLAQIDGSVEARIGKLADAKDGGTEVTILVGSGRGVAMTWSAQVLDGDTDRPLAGGELVIARIDKRFTVARSRLSHAQLEANTHVRLSAPQPASAVVTEKAPNGIAHVEIRYSFGSLHCSNTHSYAINWTGTDYRTDTGQPVDSARIAALRKSIANVVPSEREQSCQDHTDDYPSFEVAFGVDPARAAVVLTSTSNCGSDNAPWNVVRDGKRFAQGSSEIGDAVHALLAAVDPERWTIEQPARSNWYQRCERR